MEVSIRGEVPQNASNCKPNKTLYNTNESRATATDRRPKPQRDYYATREITLVMLLHYEVEGDEK